MKYDFIIVGSGLAGSVIARQLAEAGRAVLVVEKRAHVGGNMHDRLNEAGIHEHLYGPHIFHTNKKELVDYMHKFAEWQNFKVRCMAEIDGKFITTPFGFSAIDAFYSKEDALTLKNLLLTKYSGRDSAVITELLASGDEKIKAFAQFLLEKDFLPYAAKQWGLHIDEVDINVLARVPIKFSYSDAYIGDIYQMLPKKTYSHFFTNLLAHENITVQVNEDAMKHITFDFASNKVLWDGKPAPTVVYTGSLDALLNYKYGELPYRSLVFEWQTLPQASFQPVEIVAYPNIEKITRITEYKKMMQNPPENCTTIAIEYPLAASASSGGAEPYYPISTPSNIEMANKYRHALAQMNNLHLCGRLAEYKYYNMDEVLGSALSLSNKLLVE